MAIFIKEDPSKSTIMAVALGALFLIIMAILSYYLFFSLPYRADITETEGYERASLFAGANLDVDSVLKLPAWGLLNQESLVPPLITEITSRRVNIFQKFSN